MRDRGRLTVRQVVNLGSPGVYSDGGGLYLRIRSSGTRSWIFVCMVKGRRREMGLGSAFDVTLSQARTKAAAARTAFLEGRDPIEERVAASAPHPVPITFGEFAEALIDDIEGGFRNEKHRRQWRSTLKTHAVPILGKQISDVDTDDIVSVLKPIWLRLPETASRVRGRIERILDAGKAKGHRTGENPARWRGHLDLLLPRRSKVEQEHFAALPFSGIGDFVQSLRTRPALAARALEFTILTAARSGETLGMTWAEVDLSAAIWTVPAERMKAGAAHQVPLSQRAMAILRSIKPADAQDADIVFQSAAGSKLSNMAMAMLLRRMGSSSTVHGFRSAFRDWAGERTSFRREDVEMALAHTIGSKAERAYRRGRALEKRRELMQAWNAFCDIPASSLINAAA